MSFNLIFTLSLDIGFKYKRYNDLEPIFFQACKTQFSQLFKSNFKRHNKIIPYFLSKNYYIVYRNYYNFLFLKI